MRNNDARHVLSKGLESVPSESGNDGIDDDDDDDDDDDEYAVAAFPYHSLCSPRALFKAPPKPTKPVTSSHIDCGRESRGKAPSFAERRPMCSSSAASSPRGCREKVER